MAPKATLVAHRQTGRPFDGKSLTFANDSAKFTSKINQISAAWIAFSAPLSLDFEATAASSNRWLWLKLAGFGGAPDLTARGCHLAHFHTQISALKPQQREASVSYGAMDFVSHHQTSGLSRDCKWAGSRRLKAALIQNKQT